MWISIETDNFICNNVSIYLFNHCTIANNLPSQTKQFHAAVDKKGVFIIHSVNY